MNAARRLAIILATVACFFVAAKDCKADEAVKVLDEICHLVCKGMQLGDMASVLGDEMNVKFAFEEGVDKKVKIFHDTSGKTLRVALTEILEPLKLGFAAEGETITIGPAKKK